MFVSFLVPVYNVEKYLEKCVDSLLLQTGCDFEIVLLDDSSTDSSGTICDRYAAEHPDTVRVIHKANEGSFFTRRRGFREARGDWFICVDSDDYVAPDLLQRIVDTAASTGADMVMYNFAYFDENGVVTPSRLDFENGALFEGESKQRIYEKRLLSVDVNMIWMRAMKREIVDLETDYSGCGIRNMCDDALQMLAIYTNARKIVYLAEPLYFYRKWSGSITGRDTLDRWEASTALFAHTEPYLKIWNVSDEVAACFYTKHLEFLCNYVRWLYTAKPGELPASLREMIAQLKNAPDFTASRKYYRREYAHSRYLSLLVPVLTHGVQTENLLLIRLVLGLEARLTMFKKTISGRRKQG